MLKNLEVICVLFTRVVLPQRSLTVILWRYCQQCAHRPYYSYCTALRWNN
uniref:Uncharacterized protein n=1 Tax=Anguilla anguilla TaxID=7936 RepID=A0A0E9VIS1_ANGAN